MCNQECGLLHSNSINVPETVIIFSLSNIDHSFAKIWEVNRNEYRQSQQTSEVQLVPLPAGAQFLNVIESVFSGWHERSFITVTMNHSNMQGRCRSLHQREK